MVLKLKKYNCNKCKDKKHIFNVKTGIWEDCGCLKQNKIEEKYLTSHLPKLYWNYGWKDCLKDFESLSKEIYFLKKVVELQLKSKGFKKFLYIYSENQEVGKCLVSVMFREFIKKGLACNIISLEQLVDAEFDKELRKEIVYDNYGLHTKYLPYLRSYKLKKIRSRIKKESSII